MTNNVIDHFKYWKLDAIRANLDKKRHPFSVLLCNWQNDFNIGGAIRNANAFLATSVFIWGNAKYDKRGCVGTHLYENIEKFKSVERLDELLANHVSVAFENTEDAEPLDSFVWPENPLLIFGQESCGVPQELLQKVNHTVYIPQYGSVRSLNAACASAIAMYDWCVKNAKHQHK